MTDTPRPSSDDTPVEGYGPRANDPVNITKPSGPSEHGSGSTRYDDGYNDARQDAAGERKDKSIRRLFHATLALGGLLLLGALALTVYTAYYMSTSAAETDDWAGIGYVLAVAVAVPTLLALGLSWLGLKLRHRSPNGALALTVIGLVGICFIFLTSCSAGVVVSP